MQRRAGNGLASAVAAAMILAVGAFDVACAAAPVQERIEMLSGGKCLVRHRRLECAAVATYLRDELNLARGHLIRVAAGQAVDVSYQQLHALFDSLREAGFATNSR